MFQIVGSALSKRAWDRTRLGKKCGTLCQILIILSIEISFNQGFFSSRAGTVQKNGQRPAHVNLTSKPIPFLRCVPQTVLLCRRRSGSRTCGNICSDHTSPALSGGTEKIDRHLRAHQRHEQIFPICHGNAVLPAIFPDDPCKLLWPFVFHTASLLRCVESTTALYLDRLTPII